MLIKKIAGLLVILLLSACTEAESPASVERKNKMRDNPETRAMLAAFKQQKHRLEFNRCELLYNGTPFRMGMTIRELEYIFGPYDFFSRGHYIWKESGIVFGDEIKAKEDKNKSIRGMYIYMDDSIKDRKKRLKRASYPKQDYFLLEGIPIDKNTQFRNFIKNSYFELDEFSISDMGYRWKMECNGKNKSIEYGLFVRGGWNYTGSGHIRLKSDPNEDNINPVTILSIYEVIEDY